MPSTAEVDIWGYPDEAAAGRDLAGYSIEAIDGSIGKVDNANNDAGASWLIVDTGPWIFGKKVMLPAGVVSRINSETEVLRVNRTKEQIKNAPATTDPVVAATKREPAPLDVPASSTPQMHR